MAQESKRATGCGNEPANDELTRLLRSVQQAYYHYMLLKSDINDANTSKCYDKFAIGWMVHLQKL